tara:strand:- start:8630 stop:9553 length:924 start_codon:yes stop_codon:yes gene_type:complete
MYSKAKQIKTIGDMVSYYLHSPQFLALRPRSQKDYEYVLTRALATPVSLSKVFESIKIAKVSVSDCKIVYQAWLQKGKRTANSTATVLSVVFNMAEELELLASNPMRRVKKAKQDVRRVMWSRDQVKLFLDTAYGEYKWRSIGLIVHMAYEFAQRVGDMRLLKWKCIDFDTNRLNLVQSKRRAEVQIPINASLLAMLKEQHDDFGFQEYVAPHVNPRDGDYRPYNEFDVSILVNEVKSKANLPKELTAMDMRRTAITEMVEAGVDTTQIMAVSGHNSPNSMRPYIKHTFKSANNALTRRDLYRNEIS